LAKSFSKDGIASESGLKFHIQHMQTMEKSIGDVPLSKVTDFRFLEEIRREMGK
jgi:hypothetical protein